MAARRTPKPTSVLKSDTAEAPILLPLSEVADAKQMILFIHPDTSKILPKVPPAHAYAYLRGAGSSLSRN